MSKGTYSDARKAKESTRWAAIQPGTRVQLHPATDAWMRGDRYGEIAKLGSKYATVKMDTSGRNRRVAYDNLIYMGAVEHGLVQTGLEG